MATLSLLTVPAIIAAFFSCSATILDSTLSSIHRRVITHGRFWPMRWQRSADCHSAAGFHHLSLLVSIWQVRGKGKVTYGSTMNTRDASVKFSATPPAFNETRKTSTSGFVIK